MLWLILAFAVLFPIQAKTVKPAVRVETIAADSFVREEKLDSKLMVRQMLKNAAESENQLTQFSAANRAKTANQTTFSKSSGKFRPKR